MYAIQIHVQGDGTSSEVLQEDLNTAALLVESLVGQVLLELFEIVIVQQVLVSYMPTERRDGLAPPPP